MPVRPTKGDVGLGNCDNTSDVNKPVSTAQAAADAALGTWQAYTPSLSTGWTLGNGTNASRYAQNGKTVHFTVCITWGSTSTFGTGLNVGLPVTSASNPNRFNGVARGSKAGVNDYIWSWLGATTTVVTVCVSGSATPITPTSPFTWASGDQIYLSGTYEAA